MQTLTNRFRVLRNSDTCLFPSEVEVTLNQTKLLRHLSRQRRPSSKEATDYFHPRQASQSHRRTDQRRALQLQHLSVYFAISIVHWDSSGHDHFLYGTNPQEPATASLFE